MVSPSTPSAKGPGGRRFAAPALPVPARIGWKRPAAAHGTACFAALGLLVLATACGGATEVDSTRDPKPAARAEADTQDMPTKPSIPPASAAPSPTGPSPTPTSQVERFTGPVEKLAIEVLASYPHDPTAFTQGLLWHEGELYESTGLWGRSSLRRTLPDSGMVVVRHDLERQFFAEGLALVDERLIQLTWKAGLALVYDRESLVLVDQWGYNGEGWGLAYDGERLIMSDGSPRLTYRSAEDFRWLETVEVTDSGKPLSKINELEYVDGKLYANVWGEDRIVRLDPRTGIVEASIKVENLLTPAESRVVDVLNGIARLPTPGRFLITGKRWPAMFEVEFVPRD